MKRITLVGEGGRKLRLNGQAPVAVAVLLILDGESCRKGMTGKSLVSRLVEYGILFSGKDGEATPSSLLQRLLKLGAVKHPDATDGT